MNSTEARTKPTAHLYQLWRDSHLHIFSDGESVHPGDREDFEVEDAVAFQAFKWGYAGHFHLLDLYGPDGGIWDVMVAAHNAGYSAYDGSRNEWGWNPED